MMLSPFDNAASNRKSLNGSSRKTIGLGHVLAGDAVSRALSPNKGRLSRAGSARDPNQMRNGLSMVESSPEAIARERRYD